MAIFITKSEEILLHKIRRIRKLAEKNRQTELLILIKPGGKIGLVKCSDQEEIRFNE